FMSYSNNRRSILFEIIGSGIFKRETVRSASVRFEYGSSIRVWKSFLLLRDIRWSRNRRLSSKKKDHCTGKKENDDRKYDIDLFHAFSIANLWNKDLLRNTRVQNYTFGASFMEANFSITAFSTSALGLPYVR